jgi:hypothetical protein
LKLHQGVVTAGSAICEERGQPDAGVLLDGIEYIADLIRNGIYSRARSVGGGSAPG